MLAPGGFPLWDSAVEPGSVHDITAACIHALPALPHCRHRAAHSRPDVGYDGAGISVHIPVEASPP